ncbi:hypothetical protein KJJ36_13855 [Staphylococcus pseudoxylosus]|uniref:hypothetical protein n=1 Tax=Staphylococcus pseudoxylosus TaxID=2282419 RepID=UPI001F25EB32|nr:hypothetical protein [Staphylococcus pseudoxylosus]MCE5003451.1 hypothetical protein [Staphylococcus pseudoxylosus]
MHKQEIMLKAYGTPLDVKVFIDILKEQGTLIYLKGYHKNCMKIIKYDKSKGNQCELILKLNINGNLKDLIGDESEGISEFNEKLNSVSLSYLSKLLHLVFDVSSTEEFKHMYIKNGAEVNEL